MSRHGCDPIEVAIYTDEDGERFAIAVEPDPLAELAEYLADPTP